MRQWQRALQILRAGAEGFNSDLLTEPGTLVVTMLRHPISRIFSSYFFEGRFTLKQRSRRPENAQSIAGWYDAIDIERRKNAPRRSIWLDVQNYYIQVLSGHRWQRPVARSAANASFDNVEWRADYEKAAAILGAFDVVLVMEWLHCREQSEWLQQRLGLSEAISQARQLNRRTINPARLYAKVNASDLSCSTSSTSGTFDSTTTHEAHACADPDAPAGSSSCPEGPSWAAGELVLRQGGCQPAARRWGFRAAAAAATKRGVVVVAWWAGRSPRRGLRSRGGHVLHRESARNGREAARRHEVRTSWEHECYQ